MTPRGGETAPFWPKPWEGGRRIAGEGDDIAGGRAACGLDFTRYCHHQYCMLNGKTGGAGEDHKLRNVDCNIQRGGAIKEVRNAKNRIDQCTIPNKQKIFL